MTNRRLPQHMVERVAAVEREAPPRAGAACAVRGCREHVAGVLCEAHWFALPWSLRNSAGHAGSAPQEASREWMADALALLEPARSRRDTTPLGREERRFPALRVLRQYDPRPSTVGECLNRGREMPCPYVSCPEHLYLDVLPNGTLHFNHPGREPWELEETCADEVARRGGVGPMKAGKLIGLKRGRVGQIERAFRKQCEMRGLRPDPR